MSTSPRNPREKANMRRTVLVMAALLVTLTAVYAVLGATLLRGRA